MRRGAEQRVRKFLAQTFQNDCPATVTRGEVVKGTSSFVIRFGSIDGPLSSECVGLNIAFFNRTSKSFTGKSFRTEIGDEPIVFHAFPTQVSLVIESICVDQHSGAERVSCWWHTPLESALKTASLKLYKGSSLLMYLDSSVWPAPLLGGTVYFEVSSPQEMVSLPSLLPPLVCVRESFTEMEKFGSAPFRAVVSRICIQEQMSTGVTGVFEESGTWSAVVFMHNTHMLLSPVVELPLVFNKEGCLFTSKEIPFSSILPHPGTNLVCCLRFKRAREARFRAVGFTCFDLLTGTPTFCDCDVNLSQLPLLKGPFSCEEPRCLSLEYEQPYAQLPLAMDMRISFYDTPTPAPKWVEELPPIDITRKKSESRKPADRSSRSKSGLATPDIATASLDARGTDVRTPVTNLPGSPAPVRERREDHDLVKDNAGIYKLLVDIMEEIRELKVFSKDLASKEATKRRESSHVDPLSPEEGLAALTKPVEDARPVGVQELQLRPVALPKNRQAAISDGVRPLINPQTMERVLETATTVDPHTLPHNQLLLRFEGLTYGQHGSPMPSSVVVVASYSALPLQVMGPMRVRRVLDADNDYGPSFQFSDPHNGSGAGYLWYEPIESATDSTLESVKACSSIYLHLYDGISMFYMASAIFKPSKVIRSSNSVMASQSFDLTLFEDLSMAERDVPDAVPLIASTDVGFLHMTAAVLGLPTPSGARVIGAGRSASTESSGAPNGGLVYVRKLPADFGDECRSAFQQPDLKPVGFEGVGDNRASLHRLRANFVKNLLSNPDTTALARHINGGRIMMTDNEHRLRYVEKRRDEVKSTKIAETLRARITTKLSLTAWLGSPQVVASAFANPFPVQSTFRIEIPTSSPCLVLHPETPPVITLGPHASTNIKLVVSVDEMSSRNSKDSAFHTQLLVKTLTNEVSRVIDLDVRIVSPIIHRRFEIFGSAGETVARRFHSRAFPSSPNVAALGALCHYCKVLVVEGGGESSVSCTAETRAVVEPLSPAMVAAWEEVIVTSTIPKSGETARLFVILFKDAEMTECWETWEVTLTTIQRFHTQQIFYGQTSLVTLPLLCQSAHSSDPNADAITHRDCVVLKIRPMSEGAMVFHVRMDGETPTPQRVIVTVPCVLPKPSYEDSIDVTYAQSGGIIQRLLTFTNREARHKKFFVSTNYKANINVQPSLFSLAPFEVKQLRIDIFGLNYLGTEGQWPMWIFINDEDDLTVDSYLIRVTIHENHPPITPY